MHILDTDHFSILQRPASAEAHRLRFRLESLSDDERFVTVVTLEEQMRGWLAQIARAKSLAQQIEIYRRLEKLVKDYAQSNLLSFDERAAEKFQGLKAARIRIGTMDLKIAAIALANDATLLSRNLKDFSKVPGLKVEDWAA
jgi:tRNA(fMet)-specific endonuclease VapC